MLRSQADLLGHVQAYHGDIEAGLEHLVGGLRVAGNVGLRHRRHVAGSVVGAAHEDHVFHQPGQLRLLLEGQSQIGHPAQGHQGQLSLVLLRHTDDEITGRLLQRLLRRGRDLGIADAVVAMDVRDRALPLPHQRTGGAYRHRDLIVHTGELDEPQAVVGRLPGVGVAEAGGDAYHPHILPLEGKQDGNGVIDPGIGVDQNILHASKRSLFSYPRPLACSTR